ncbi:MAG: hypothetical protein EBS16_02015 [Betaproteobacteria bacterium]|nr:hypothetical protein [Betaproteobacteria bacterium]
MKLIGSLASPYVRKVRVVMAEKKLDFQLVLEDVWGSDAILQSNPLGKVPCLVMEGGEAVFDSRVIVEYLHYSLADIALGCVTGYLDFRFPDVDWRAHHRHLARHHDKLAVRPSFVDTAPPKA